MRFQITFRHNRFMNRRSTGMLSGFAALWMVGVIPATNSPASAMPPFLNEWSDQYPVLSQYPSVSLTRWHY